jgi:hypothetical protein
MFPVCLSPMFPVCTPVKPTLRVGGTMQGFVRASGIFLPSNYTATSVKLFLYTDGFGASTGISAYRITSAWEEDTLTWNVRPQWADDADDGRLFACLIEGACARLVFVGRDDDGQVVDLRADA